MVQAQPHLRKGVFFARSPKNKPAMLEDEAGIVAQSKAE
jgi:hypothetical protein